MPHIHEKIDFVSDVYIVYKDKVLLRMHDKYNIWLPPGGHVELDEEPNQTALKEVKEEVGLDVELVGEATDHEMAIFEGGKYKNLIPPRFMNIHDVNPTHQHVCFIYFARSQSDDVIEPNDDERSHGCKWFTMAELEKNENGIQDAMRYYAMTALKELGEV